MWINYFGSKIGIKVSCTATQIENRKLYAVTLKRLLYDFLSNNPRVRTNKTVGMLLLNFLQKLNTITL